MSRKEPKGAAATKSIVDERVQAALDEPGIQDTLQIEWRNAPKSLAVISMPLANLLYNPETHRIKAQRDFDAARDEYIKDDPWGEQAQAYLDFLLAALPIDPSKTDPAFDKLREDLETYGQKDPGIITPSGILINGNSRCAALRRINAPHMRVAVLPNDWSWDDVASVELELQMRKDLKRDYSFVNSLLALDEAAVQFGPDSATKAFRLQKSTFARSIWILDLLRDLVKRSAAGGAPPLNLRDFESDQGKLEELHRTFTALSKTDPDAADTLREARLLALLLDKSKTDIRLISDDFLPTYLEKQLPPEMAKLEQPAPAEIPGLGRAAQQDSAALGRLKSLVNLAATARASSVNPEQSGHAMAQSQLATLNKALESALDAAGKNARLKRSQQAAIDRLTDAADGLELSIQEIADAKSKHALDEQALGEALVNLKQVMIRFARSTSRIIESEGEGAEWLRALQDNIDE